MKRLSPSKSGQYARLQILCFVISLIALLLSSTTVALVMGALALIFGLVATVMRAREAGATGPLVGRNRRRQ